MPAEQTPDIETVLRAHVLAGSSIWAAECSCGEQEGVDYYAHVARALAPILAAAVREARAAELREAADTVEDECAADRVTCYCSSADWLRDHADRIAVDAPEGGA